jgi:hypothetical protein
MVCKETTDENAVKATMTIVLDEAEVERRKPVWAALSELWLGTDRTHVRGWGLRRPNHGLTTVVTTVIFTAECPSFSSRQVVVESSGVASSWGRIGERNGRGFQRPIARFRRSRVAFASRVVMASGAPWVSRSITARASRV